MRHRAGNRKRKCQVLREGNIPEDRVLAKVKGETNYGIKTT